MVGLTVDLSLLKDAKSSSPSKRSRATPSPQRRGRQAAFENKPFYSTEQRMCGSYASAPPSSSSPSKQNAAVPSDDELERSPWTRSSDAFGSHYGSKMAPVGRATPSPPRMRMPQNDVLGAVDVARERPHGVTPVREPRRAAAASQSATPDPLPGRNRPSPAPAPVSTNYGSPARRQHSGPMAPTIPLGIRDYSRDDPPPPRGHRMVRGGDEEEPYDARGGWPSHPLPPTPPRRSSLTQQQQPAASSSYSEYPRNTHPPPPSHAPPSTSSPARLAMAAADASSPARLEEEYRQHRQARLAQYEVEQRQQLQSLRQSQLRTDPNAFDAQFSRLARERHHGSDAAALLTFPA